MTDADRIAAIVRKAEDSCCNVTIDEIRWLADRAAGPLTVGCPGCAGALAGLVDTICDACRAAVVDALARPLTVGAALASYRASDAYAIEWLTAGGWNQAAIAGGNVETRGWLDRRAGGPDWSLWTMDEPLTVADYHAPARPVPLAEADANPATRGEMP